MEYNISEGRVMTTLSHQHFSEYDQAYTEIQQRISGNKTLEASLEGLGKVEFGRFLIEHRGLNAYWTDVMVNFPNYTAQMRQKYSQLEQNMLDYFPTAQATQERFMFFKQAIKRHTKNGSKVLAAPSGLLPEFMQFNECAEINNIDITAYDIDSNTQALLKSRLCETNLEPQVQYVCQNIFELMDSNQYNLVVSNGLNIYIKDQAQVRSLYQIFYQSLKREGVLITSFLTPPPIMREDSPWDMTQIDSAWLVKQKQVFSDILNVTWACYMTEDQFVNLLTEVGFQDIQLKWDKQRMFPTVIAFK